MPSFEHTNSAANKSAAQPDLFRPSKDAVPTTNTSNEEIASDQSRNISWTDLAKEPTVREEPAAKETVAASAAVAEPAQSVTTDSGSEKSACGCGENAEASAEVAIQPEASNDATVESQANALTEDSCCAKTEAEIEAPAKASLSRIDDRDLPDPGPALLQGRSLQRASSEGGRRGRGRSNAPRKVEAQSSFGLVESPETAQEKLSGRHANGAPKHDAPRRERKPRVEREEQSETATADAAAGGEAIRSNREEQGERRPRREAREQGERSDRERNERPRREQGEKPGVRPEGNRREERDGRRGDSRRVTQRGGKPQGFFAKLVAAVKSFFGSPAAAATPARKNEAGSRANAGGSRDGRPHSGERRHQGGKRQGGQRRHQGGNAHRDQADGERREGGNKRRRGGRGRRSGGERGGERPQQG